MIVFVLFPGMVAIMLFCVHEWVKALTVATEPEGM